LQPHFFIPSEEEEEELSLEMKKSFSSSILEIDDES